MQFHSCHTNCNAKLLADPGETKKSWVLAEIVEKEYCQAKKVRAAVFSDLGIYSSLIQLEWVLILIFIINL